MTREKFNNHKDFVKNLLKMTLAVSAQASPKERGDQSFKTEQQSIYSDNHTQPHKSKL